MCGLTNPGTLSVMTEDEIQVLQAVKDGARSVQQVATQLGMRPGRVEISMAQLVEKGIVQFDDDGCRWVEP